MALSKTLDDLSLGSDIEKKDLCGACEVDGEYRSAVKFCLDCCQQICQTCVDCHRRIKLLQGHKLVDNHNEDAVKVAKTLSSCLACPSHADKKIEFICLDHDGFCCSTCATVNHRGCRQVKEVAALAQTSSAISTTQKHLNDAKAAIEGIVNLRQENKRDIQEQIDKIIPKQIKEMKSSIMKTFDELERYLFLETYALATSITNYPEDYEIVRWQSRIKTIKEAIDLISVVQQNGTNIHKYIATKNVEKKLADIDKTIFQAKELNLCSLSFSFEKQTFLQNASVVVNGSRVITKSLADIEQRTVETFAGKSKHVTDRAKSTPFARLATKTNVHSTPGYSYWRSRSSN